MLRDVTFSEVSSGVMEVQELATLIQTGLKDLATEVRKGFEQVDARFEQVDVRFERVDVRFERIEGRLDGVDNRLERLDERVVTVEGRLFEVDHHLVMSGIRLMSVESGLTRLSGRVGGLEDQIRGARIEVEAVLHKIDLLGDGIENLNEKMDRHIAENDRQLDEIRGVLHLI